ncbi:DsbA family protein [Stomatohabitans albus]|uniref:mycothiol-dependent nitroreductase Rv2466c family protein n=1 Tax=Stomatohabitans albus TaxID=3110766 RepID=UPI00300C4DB7
MSNADVRVYVDPECPFCWMTSTWLCKVVAPARQLNVEMRPISLWMRNEGRDLDPGYMAEKLPSLKLLRVLMALEESGGNTAFQAGYFELGRSNFNPDESVRTKPSTVDVAAMLRAIGADESLASAREDETYDDKIRLGTNEAEAIAGNDVGTPIIAIPRGDAWVGFFGPVITQIPETDNALALWDALQAMMSQDGFFELKRGRDQRPHLDQAASHL